MTRGYLAGAAAIALAWTISAIKTKDVHPFALARDRNGNISLSQLQFMLFTGICLFAIVAVEVERFSIGAGPLSLTGIPTNLLLLMGFSVGTTAVTKGIAVSYLNDGRISQDDRSSMTADRQGQPNLVKIQMLLWTLVSAGLYLLQVIRFIEQRSFATSGASFALPDVDGALLVLMGVSHGAYVTQKLVARSVGPFVNSITPSPAPVGSEVLIAGGMLGNGQGGGGHFPGGEGDARDAGGPHGEHSGVERQRDSVLDHRGGARARRLSAADRGERAGVGAGGVSDRSRQVTRGRNEPSSRVLPAPCHPFVDHSLHPFSRAR